MTPVGTEERGFIQMFGRLAAREEPTAGGFACPETVAALLERGVDPSRRNNLGLCWNDIARHVVRPKM